jgi:hypothetical protein
MLQVLEKDLERARTEIKFINYKQEFVGPRHPGFDYTYDELLHMFWCKVNCQPTTVDPAKVSKESKPNWEKVVSDVQAKHSSLQKDDYNWIELPKQFSTFDEFKLFIES